MTADIQKHRQQRGSQQRCTANHDLLLLTKEASSTGFANTNSKTLRITKTHFLFRKFFLKSTELLTHSKSTKVL